MYDRKLASRMLEVDSANGNKELILRQVINAEGKKDTEE
jgi:hypothetical protein